MIINNFDDIRIGFRIINKVKGEVGNCVGIQLDINDETKRIGCCIRIKGEPKWIKYSNEDISHYKIMDKKISYAGKSIK